MASKARTVVSRRRRRARARRDRARCTQGMGWSAKLTVAQEVPKQVVELNAKGSFHATLTGTR